MVYIFLADGFEEIEALCPLDLMRRAGIETQTVSVGRSRTVVGSHNIAVTADIMPDEISDFSMIVLPGGMPGTKNLDASPVVEKCIKTALGQDKYIAAICAAPMILGKRGILRGKNAVCFPGYEKDLIGATVSDARTVRDGKILTAVGMGASHDFGLAIVEIFKGKETAEKLGRAVIYK